jgi:Zn-dependent M28 family amino/carboxypeptidase
MNRRLVAFLALAAIAPASSTAFAKGGSDSRDPSGSAAMRKAVTVQGILAHESALQDIADLNGGTRASGTPGYTASADYVAETMRRAGYQVTRQSFEFPFFQALAPAELERIAPDPKVFVEGTDHTTADYSGSGEATAPVQAIDVQVPPAAQPSSTSACEPEDFAGFTAGNIALVQRGTCTFETKAANAEAAGASAVIVFNEGQPGRQDLLAGTLGRPFDLPVIMTTFAVGEELVNQLRAGDAVTLRVKTLTESETRTTENVIADSRKGDPAKTIVVGAHLDSVVEGPGINDNGSGTSTLIEIARNLDKGGSQANRVRFAFWGAEEKGLLGSEHYVSTLPADELAKIKANLNFDMLGSPNFVRFVYDGDGSNGENDPGPTGSAYIEGLFLDYFADQGLASEPTAFDGRSDYESFVLAGIPAGGLFSGAEGVKTAEEQQVYGGTADAPYDSCYHQACDTIANLSTTALDQLGDAAAHGTWVLSRARNEIVDGATTDTGGGRDHGHGRDRDRDRGHGHKQRRGFDGPQRIR